MNITFDFLNQLCISELCFVQTYVASRSDYPMHNKGRRHHGLLYTVKGTETYQFGIFKVEAVPGSVLYIPKDENYIITLSDPESIVMVLDFETTGKHCAPFLVRFSDSGSVKSYFTRLETDWNRNNPAYLPDCKSSFYRIVGLMAKQLHMYQPAHKYDKIAKGVDYLHENYLQNDFRLETAAAHTGVSYRYFETLFREKHGASPKEYVLNMKIERAKELLLSEKMLIRDIALTLGYSDIYHFGKIFTAKTGVTPSEYKNSCMEKG